MLHLLTPWFLAGLGALAVPVLVHLTQKERREVVPFPSLMFLAHVPYQSVRRQRIRHWLLLLLRCLALALLVMAFTRPFFASRGAVAGTVLSGRGRDIVIVLDRSYSMEYGDRWRRAVAAARGVIDRLGAGDRAAVVTFAGMAAVAEPFTHDKTALLTAVTGVRPTAGVTRYDAAFRLVRRVLADTTRERREVVLVSDAQRSGWGGRELPPLPAGTTFTQVNVGDSITANILVTNVDVRYDTGAGRERALVEARVANRGPRPVLNHPVTFELNGRQMQTRRVDCPANGVVRVVFDPVPAPPGVSRGVVRTGPDALERDNDFYFRVAREQSLPVLLVEPSDAPAASGTFLTQALRIGGARLTFHVRVTRDAQLSVHDLRGVALVILDGAAIPGGTLGRQLTNFVKDGGGLWVVLGSRSRPESWPALADQLLPRPAAPVDRGADHGATLEFFDRGHPVFELFNAPRSGTFSAARFVRYWTVKPDHDDRQLARFDDGRMALLERRVGAGRVLVWSSDLSGAWNDFPLQPVFLPLVHQAAKYAAGYEEDSHWATVGELLNLPRLFGEGPRRADSASARATAGGAQYVAIAPSGAQTRFSMNTVGSPAVLELSEQGFYDVRRTGGAGDSAQVVAVNVDPVESDLTPLDTGLFAAAVAPPRDVPGKTAQQTAQLVGASTSGDLERRQSVWWYLLAAALLLLGAETLLSNRLSSRPTHRAH